MGAWCDRRVVITPISHRAFAVVRRCREFGCSDVVRCFVQSLITSWVSNHWLFFNILHIQYSDTVVFLFNTV